MAELMFGMETEYALASSIRAGLAIPPPAPYELIRQASRLFGALPEPTGKGIFLANGSRFYVDSGHHPEVSTPECLDPTDLVRYLLAGDRMLERLSRQVLDEYPAYSWLRLTKCNVDYGTEHPTWGSHESYLHRATPSSLPAQIVPHLVSRIVYAGAGGFDNTTQGIRFLISPRVPHLEHVISEDSTYWRGIYHTKDESLSRQGYHRLHLLSGESLCSQTASWLRVGATALVVAMAEAGLKPGREVTLAYPIVALRAFATDPTLRSQAHMKGGRSMTAIAIQRHYLLLAEANLGAPFFPSWAADVCRVWRETLDMLERSLERAAGVLDWGIKRSLFGRYLERQGYSWDALRSDGLLKDADLVRRLRRELCELDTCFSLLGEEGVFNRLDQAGVLSHRLPGVDAIDRAMTSPPARGRAKVRGECIRRLAPEHDKFSCTWQGIWNRERRALLDLTDPFTAGESWHTQESARPDRSAGVHILRLIRHLELGDPFQAGEEPPF